MKHLIMIAMAFAVVGCLPVQTKKQIIVDGEATIEVEPDSFRLVATIRSRSEKQDAVLSELSKKLDTFTDQMPTLEGLTSLKIEPSEMEVQPVFESDCEDGRNYSLGASCPIMGYLAEIVIDLEGSPAILAGNTFSLANEVGAERVSFSEYFISDYSSLNRQADQKAFEAAQAKASRLAESAGVRLLGPLKISDTGLRNRGYEVEDLVKDEGIVVSATRNARVDLTIHPQPISITRKVSVAFEIE